jgi:hypothetical protein
MPPLGGPTQTERELLAEWIDCGMPASGDGFEPPPPSGTTQPEPPPTGACAEPRPPLPPEILPRCKATTLDCVVQCDADSNGYNAEDCRNACLAADDTPLGAFGTVPVNCAACTLLQLLSCADRTGCHAETADFLCCIEACGGGDSCANVQCTGELQAFGLCVYYLAPECVDYIDGPVGSCFAEPG